MATAWNGTAWRGLSGFVDAKLGKVEGIRGYGPVCHKSHMIIRTYGCEVCGKIMEVTLRAEQWDALPPDCPDCVTHGMHQEFKPVAIGGSNSSRAHAVAEDIMANDYNVADFKSQGPDGGPPKVRYKDAISTVPPSTWGAAEGAIAQAISLGRETRLKHGSGLDVLQTTLKNGSQPDLIELSKRRSMRVW